VGCHTYHHCYIRADEKAIMQKDQRDYSEFLRQRKDAEEQLERVTPL
jgi:hypothetical protein